jgi:hypothetical protein
MEAKMKNKVMGRAALGLGFAWLLTLGTTALGLQGCANDPAAEQESESGSIDLALSGTSSSGITYRLREASISITGAGIASVSTEDHLNQTLISLELPAGGYLAALADGWRLERSVDGVFEDIRAVLVSTNPLPFTVLDQETTEVRLVFRAGEDVVELGNGRVNIGIDVIDGEPPPPGGCDEACAVAEGLGCTNAAICLDICTNLPALVTPECAPLGDEYVACAAGQPGETYVCSTEESYPVAAACEGEFLAVIDCISNPTCTVDADGDGSCEGTDCNDADGSVFPGAPDTCGDGIDQNCNGIDDCAPAGWSCPAQFFGTTDGCDCGCGVQDPDCSSSDASVCEFCNDAGSCSVDTCPGNIDPSNNAVCL